MLFRSDPSWSNALAIMAVMSPQFKAMALRPSGVISVEDADAADPCVFRLQASVTGLSGTVGKFLEDGVLDHRERAMLREEVPAVINKLQAFMASDERGVVRLKAEGTVK